MNRLLVLSIGTLLFLLAVISTTPAGGQTPLVGYVGCSQTRDVARGIELIDASPFWNGNDIGNGYNGGTILRWGRSFDDRSKYWSQFDRIRSLNPGTTDVWLEICVKDREGHTPRTSRTDAALATIAEIERRIPGVTVHVSPMNEYDPVGLCTLAGPGGPGIAAEVAAEVVAAGAALEGPTVGPLTSETTSEGCHANEAGQILQASQLAAYFDEYLGR